MKAVNLIPSEERRGVTSPGGGRGAYGVIGVLAALVLGVALFVIFSNQVTSRRNQVADLTAKAAAAEQRAAALKPYTDFASLKASRVETVREIAASRFQWERTMRDLAKVMPQNAWLTAFTGSTGSGTAPASGQTSTGAAPGQPSIQLSGCTTSNDNVTRLISRLRLVRGVVRVSLAQATKPGGVTTTASGASQGCGGDNHPQFSLTLYFQPLTGLPTVTGTTTAAAPATGTQSTTPSAGTSTPVSTGGSR